MAKTLIQDGSGINLNVQGRRVEAIFAIARISQFTETTQCLEEEIIVFVNKIVKIIHECTIKWEGMPTKNYGDKYLLTWLIPSFEDAIDLVRGEELER